MADRSGARDRPGARGGMGERWRSARPVVRDGIGAVALMLVSLLPLGIDGLRLGEMQREYPLWVPVMLVVAQTLPLTLRRAVPALALALSGIAFAVTQTLGASTGLAGLGLLIALYSCGVHLRRGRLAVVLASAAVYLTLVAVLVAQRSPEKPIDWITFAAVLAVPWVTGELVRRWRAEQSARLERAAADADRAARSLLARDLHDIVTHHVTAMVVQSESARYLAETPDGAAERDAIFTSVASTGRLALTELRSLLGTLDPDAAAHSPAALAEAGDISNMVQRLKETGYPISLRLTGAVDELPPEVVAVMRSVAREAVTNAMKHARGMPVQLVIAATENEMALTIINALAATASPDAVGSGRGTSGMANRVAEIGGTFTSEATGNQYTTTARWTR
ncbi:sensor histidine kinase [Microbacterium sp. A196]|uniref:sensor histidine kinase n=1 Tax=Microbacterium sp. A196 TaxID=3457320 RepID=UPI003FD42A0F